MSNTNCVCAVCHTSGLRVQLLYLHIPRVSERTRSSHVLFRGLNQTLDLLYEEHVVQAAQCWLVYSDWLMQNSCSV